MEVNIINTLNKCYEQYKGRKLLKKEFDNLAEELNVKSDGKLLKTARKINEHIEKYGYTIHSKRQTGGELKSKTLYELIKK